MSEKHRPKEIMVSDEEPLNAQEVTDLIESKKAVYTSRLVKRFNFSPSLAEDIYQEALLSVVKKAAEGKIDRKNNPAGYMQTVIQNKALSHLSRASTSRELPIPDSIPGTDYTTEEIVNQLSQTHDAHTGVAVVSSRIPDPETSTLDSEIKYGVQDAIESFIDAYAQEHEGDDPLLIRTVVEKRMLHNETSQQEIATRFGVARSVVRRIEEAAGKQLRKKLRKFTDIK